VVFEPTLFAQKNWNHLTLQNLAKESQYLRSRRGCESIFLETKPKTITTWRRWKLELMAKGWTSVLSNGAMGEELCGRPPAEGAERTVGKSQKWLRQPNSFGVSCYRVQSFAVPFTISTRQGCGRADALSVSSGSPQLCRVCSDFLGIGRESPEIWVLLQPNGNNALRREDQRLTAHQAGVETLNLKFSGYVTERKGAGKVN